MPTVETAEEFVSRLERKFDEQEEERGDNFTEDDARAQLVLQLEQRDAAVRAEALREAAALCTELWRNEHDAGPDERMGDGTEQWYGGEGLAKIDCLIEAANSRGIQ